MFLEDFNTYLLRKGSSKGEFANIVAFSDVPGIFNVP